MGITQRCGGALYLNQNQIMTISDLSDELRQILPWKNNVFSDKKKSFLGICEDLDLTEFYRGINPISGIRHLLESTLENVPQKFPKLVLEVVNRGILYSSEEGKKFYYENAEKINQLMFRLGYKIPELLSHRFLNSLPHK